MAHKLRGAQFLENGYFAVTGRETNYRLNLTGRGIVAETRSVNVIRWNNAFEGRLNNLFGRSRDDVEGELMPTQILQQLRKQSDVLFQADPLANLDQVFLAHASQIGIVQQQVGEF